ncbi:MAG: hypothetical protein RMK29_07155 [Myxococcales bacterium]|nr:hypothetical protein [Myxococcota bacterium]MDW8281472.1 hypothetical protein [Myxococcales bacterium]
MRPVTWPLVLAALCGCDIRLDPDSLVRELRVLGARVGDDAPGSVADVDLGAEVLRLRALVAVPARPDRCGGAARVPQVDWYLCLTARSLLVPRAVDPDCARFGPQDPDPKRGESPVLVHLASGEQVDVPLGPLRAELVRRLRSMPGMGGLPAGLPLRPTQVFVPVVVRAQVAGTPGDDLCPAEAETAFLSARLVLTPPGQLPLPPNRNPMLGGVWALAEPLPEWEDPPGPPLTPCPPDGPCQPVPVPRGGSLYLRAVALDRSAEWYLPLDESGRDLAIEVLRFSWFSTDGEFSELRTGGSSRTTRWRDQGDYAAPPEVRTVSVFVVLQDNRGGADWARYDLLLQDAGAP